MRSARARCPVGPFRLLQRRQAAHLPIRAGSVRSARLRLATSTQALRIGFHGRTNDRHKRLVIEHLAQFAPPGNGGPGRKWLSWWSKLLRADWRSRRSDVGSGDERDALRDGSTARSRRPTSSPGVANGCRHHRFRPTNLSARVTRERLALSPPGVPCSALDLECLAGGCRARESRRRRRFSAAGRSASLPAAPGGTLLSSLAASSLASLTRYESLSIWTPSA